MFATAKATLERSETLRARYERLRKKPTGTDVLSGIHGGQKVEQNPHRVDLAGVALSNANERCTYCQGTGRVKAYKATRVCVCAYRGIARKCMDRYRIIRTSGPWGKCSIQRSEGGGLMRGFKEVEFLADVDLAARRVLSAEERKVYELYSVGGFAWDQCARKLGMDRGNFFHAVYSVERKLGKAVYLAGIFPAGRYLVEDVDPDQIAKPVNTNYNSPNFRLTVMGKYRHITSLKGAVA